MHDPHPTPCDLPWDWFDFTGVARNPRKVHDLPTVDAGGFARVYHVTEDGRDVPFKLFRRPGNHRPALLLLHGMGLTPATFRGIAPYLLPTHDLILPDYSSLLTTTTMDASLKSFVRTVFRVADALHVPRFSLGGNSLGGGITLMAAIVDADNPTPRLQKLLLSNPACFPQPLPLTYRLARTPGIGELLMALSNGEKLVAGVEYISYVDKSKFPPPLKQRYIAALSSLTNRLRVMNMMRQLPSGTTDTTLAPHLPRLKDIRAPALISWGGRDPLLVEGAGERLAAALPNSAFDRHGDLAHMPHEEEPARIGRRWAAFLNTCPAAVPPPTSALKLSQVSPTG